MPANRITERPPNFYVRFPISTGVIVGVGFHYLADARTFAVRIAEDGGADVYSNVVNSVVFSVKPRR